MQPKTIPSRPHEPTGMIAARLAVMVIALCMFASVLGVVLGYAINPGPDCPKPIPCRGPDLGLMECKPCKKTIPPVNCIPSICVVPPDGGPSVPTGYDGCCLGSFVVSPDLARLWVTEERNTLE